jgi:hypothetical protein
LDAHDGVDIWGVGGGAGEPVFGVFGVWSVDEDFEVLADLLLGVAEGEGLLCGEEFMEALLFDCFGKVVVESVGGGSGFAGVGEGAEAFEGVIVDEAEELLEVVFCFTGESDDEGGAEDKLGPALTEALEELFEAVALPGSAHAFEDVGLDVLEWHIEVRDDSAGGGEGVEELVGEMFWEGVEEADPAEGGIELVELLEELGESGLAVEIEAVGGEVLGDEDEFAGAVVGEGAGFGEDVFDGEGTERSADGGDGAEGAGAVAAFANFEVGVVFGGDAQSWGHGVLVRGAHGCGSEEVALFEQAQQSGGELFEGVGAQAEVDIGEQLWEL